MGKRGGYQGAVQHRTFFEKTKSQSLVWVPKIPSWEKEFCYKVGQFRWENFLEAKKETRFCYKILEWDDSAAEEAFHRSKNRYFASIKGLPNPDEDCDAIMNPDLYIEEIDWSSCSNDEEIDWGGISDDEEEEEEEEDGNVYRNICRGHEIREEVIKPTGWDIVEEFSPHKMLTGLVLCCN